MDMPTQNLSLIKLNKLIVFVLLCFFVSSCYDRQNECDCKKIIGLDSGVMLSSKETRNNLKGLKIQHIRDEKIIENISYEYKYNIGIKKKIRLNRTKDLFRTDSIKFIFSNDRVIILHAFIVEPRYVGYKNKNFVGCSTQYCKINGKDSLFIGNGISL